jgi:Flp pilus assembly pilin Flp
MEWRSFLNDFRIVVMKISLKRTLRKQAGQGMTEYIIIVALIAVSAIAVYASFGKTIREQTSGLTHEMSGTDSTSDINDARAAATDGKSQADKNKGMGAYGSEGSLATGNK